MEGLLGLGYCQYSALGNSDFDFFKKFFLLIGPFKRSVNFDQIVEWLNNDVEVRDVAAIKTKAYKVSHYISFALRIFQILPVFNLFCNWLNSLF